MRVPVFLLVSAAVAAPAGAEISALQRAGLSAELFAAGVAAEDSLLVLAAARLRAGLDFQGGEAAQGSVTAPFDAAEMLATARDLAAGDDALLGLIADTEAEGNRGVATGQVYSISEIGDGATDTYDPLPFAAGEYAEVYVESRDGSDLNLFIYDAEGRLVCSDTDASAVSYCGWHPSEAGTFTIEVVNRGKGGAGYALMTN